MSSYYPSFNYMGFNSLKDKHLIVTHFDADNGEYDTFLGMDPIYTDKFDGTRRLDYGAKYNNVAVIKITVIKSNGCDFSSSDVRDFLRWTTGSRNNSFLELLIGDSVKFSFLGRVTNAYQQKMDARTIGMSIEFTSVSPWAYSPKQTITCSFGQDLTVDENGTLSKGSGISFLNVEQNGVLYNGLDGGAGLFQITTDGVVYVDNSVILDVNNQSDDLYSYIYMDTRLLNNNSSDVFIRNNTIGEETLVTDLSDGEVVTLSAGQFIISNVPNKIFGTSFNFVWPRLAPGTNEIAIGGSGICTVVFEYRVPMKIGDCAIDIYVSTCSMCGCEYSDNTTLGTVSWNDIVDTPNTIEGYGIINAYNMDEVDDKLDSIDVSIDEQELNDMLDEELD